MEAYHDNSAEFDALAIIRSSYFRETMLDAENCLQYKDENDDDFDTVIDGFLDNLEAKLGASNNSAAKIQSFMHIADVSGELTGEVAYVDSDTIFNCAEMILIDDEWRVALEFVYHTGDDQNEPMLGYVLPSDISMFIATPDSGGVARAF